MSMVINLVNTVCFDHTVCIGYCLSAHTVNNIGPQTSFPVPEGILDYHGMNYLAISLWALDATGAHLEDIELVETGLVQTAYGPIGLSPMPAYTARVDAY